MKTLIFPNKQLDDVMKIFDFLENAGLLTKVVREVVENEVKEQKVSFLATSDASLLGNMFAGT